MSVFEDVKQSLSIKQVLNFYGVNVGRNGTFICPFHNDTHPSASVKNDYFNCFVCGAGGDLITFTARMFGLSNYEACKKLIADFHLNIELDKPLSNIERLKAERERQKRLRQQKEREELDALIRHTGNVLADYHCYLWQGLQLYPLDDKRHTRALQWLEQAEYYLQCYDNNPKEYSIAARKQVGKIERRLSEWNNER